MKSYHILLAQKPFKGNFASNAINELPSGLNIDLSRIGFRSDADRNESCNKQTRKPIRGFSSKDGTIYGKSNGVGWVEPIGRFPANIILTSCKEIDLQGKAMGSPPAGNKGKVNHKEGNVIYQGGWTPLNDNPNYYKDDDGSGKVSRFFKKVKK